MWNWSSVVSVSVMMPCDHLQPHSNWCFEPCSRKERQEGLSYLCRPNADHVDWNPSMSSSYFQNERQNLSPNISENRCSKLKVEKYSSIVHGNLRGWFQSISRSSVTRFTIVFFVNVLQFPCSARFCIHLPWEIAYFKLNCFHCKMPCCLNLISQNIILGTDRIVEEKQAKSTAKRIILLPCHSARFVLHTWPSTMKHTCRCQQI